MTVHKSTVYEKNFACLAWPSKAVCSCRFLRCYEHKMFKNVM